MTPLTGWMQGSVRMHAVPNASNPYSGGVAAQGRIVPAGGVVRVAAPAGAYGQAIVDRLLVKSGDTVEANQPLAYLHGRALLQAQVDAAEHDKAAAAAALAQAEAAQNRATAELQMQLADLEGRVEVAEANAHLASVNSHLALDEARQAETVALAAVESAKHLVQAEQAASAATVATAQAQLDVIPKNRATDRTLAAANLQEAKAAQTRADAEAAAQIEEAQAKASLAAQHTRQAEAALILEPAADDMAKLAPVQAEARTARASAAAARKLLESTQAALAADIATAQARVDAADAAVAVARAQLAMSEVRAPSAGKVLAIMTHPGEAVAPSGVLQLGDISAMYVDALVYSDDIPGVHVGQKTLTTGSALPDDGLTGEVTEISPMVAGNTLPNTDPTVFSDQPVVLVKVRLDNPAPAASLINGQVKVQFAP